MLVARRTRCLTFSVWHLNAVFVLSVRNFLRDGPLNRCECLTINVYKSMSQRLLNNEIICTALPINERYFSSKKIQ
jgi:hypothetical protein